MKKPFQISNIIIGIVFTLLFISLAVIITINFRPLYYMDMNLLNIAETSGFEKEEIRSNYDALIDYSSPFYRGDLSFPTFPSSDSALQHFKEVKNIFISFYILAAVTLVFAVIIVLQKEKKKDYQYLLVSSITSIVLPIIIGICFAINFERAFVIFHKIFFQNDYWMFDPVTDPVIDILPETFFMHCAILIIFIVLIGSCSLFLIYNHKKKRSSIRYRKTEDLKF